MPLRRSRAGGEGERILVVGDSLSAEYGLTRGSGWVSLLEQRLAREGLRAASSTPASAATRRRRPRPLSSAAAAAQADARDHRARRQRCAARSAARGDPAQPRIDGEGAKARGARVLLVGMQVPPNYGRKYSDDFAAIYANVARAEGVRAGALHAEGVADIANAESMFQADRIHPVAAAHPIILANIWPVLEPMLRQPTRAAMR
jgi:acyl-CoA thioesterase-1